MPAPDANLFFWAASLANLGVVVFCAMQGVRRIRRRDVRGHRRLMTAASSLVCLFLFSYVLKVMFLGREDRDTWTPGAKTALYLHETAVLLMLVAGAVAGYRAWRFRHTLGDALEDPVEASRRGRQVHRRAGRTAVVASAAAFVTAAFWLALYADGG